MLAVVGSRRSTCAPGPSAAPSGGVGHDRRPRPRPRGWRSQGVRPGLRLGGALFNRLEGLWFGNGSIFFASTSGGDVKNGDLGVRRVPGGLRTDLPVPPDRERGLFLLFESDGGGVLDSPDNLTVSPRGGLLLRGRRQQRRQRHAPAGAGIVDINRLIGIDRRGNPFEFAVNRFSDSEFAGVCFSPDGTILFTNLQGGDGPGSGMTIAITGPWGGGPLWPPLRWASTRPPVSCADGRVAAPTRRAASAPGRGDGEEVAGVLGEHLPAEHDVVAGGVEVAGAPPDRVVLVDGGRAGEVAGGRPTGSTAASIAWRAASAMRLRWSTVHRPSGRIACHASSDRLEREGPGALDRRFGLADPHLGVLPVGDAASPPPRRFVGARAISSSSARRATPRGKPISTPAVRPSKPSSSRGPA